MSTIIAILISVGVSFGGGYLVGGKLQKNKARKEVRRLMVENKQNVEKLLVRVDSLKRVPAQLDSVTLLLINSRAELSNVSLKLDSLQKLPEKVDTLILVNKDIYLNTDTIKNELREYVRTKN